MYIKEEEEEKVGETHTSKDGESEIVNEFSGRKTKGRE